MAHAETSFRLSLYASAAAVAAVGTGTAANADLIITNVGTTFTVSPAMPPGFGGGSTVFSDVSTLGYPTIQLGAFGAINLGAFQVGYQGTAGSFFDLAAWAVGSLGEGSSSIGVATAFGKARNFLPGQSVSFNTKSHKFADTGTGGKSKSKLDPEGFSTDKAKGTMEGQVYIGLQLPAAGVDGFGGVFNYGWLDITVGFNEDDKLFLTVNRWAYESDVETAASIPGGSVVPGVGGLAALAFGAAGIRRRRERVA